MSINNIHGARHAAPKRFELSGQKSVMPTLRRDAGKSRSSGNKNYVRVGLCTCLQSDIAVNIADYLLNSHL